MKKPYKNKLYLFVFIGYCLLINNLSIAINLNNPNDTLIVAQRIDEIISLDPASMFEFAALEYAGNTYERLVNYQVDDHKLYGVIAKSWQVSADGKKYTFSIDKNKKFANGDQLTANDVVFSLQRAVKLNKAAASIFTQFGFTKENIAKKITAPDLYTVAINLDKAYAPSLFLNCLTTPAASIVNKALVISHELNGDLGNAWLNTNHAGSGPYQLQQWRHNEFLALVANPYYPQQPLLKSVIIKHINEVTTQQLLLAKGDIDIARNYQSNLDEPTKAKFYMQATPKNWLVYLALNQQHPQLKLPQVRQAMKYLIEYQIIADTLYKNQAIVQQNFIPQRIFAANQYNPYNFNLNKAKELLKEVNLEGGFKVKLEVKNLQLGQAIQHSLAQAKIDVEIIPGDSKQILTKFRARNYELLLATWEADYPDPHANASTFLVNLDNSDGSTNKTLAWRAAWDIPKLSKQVELAAIEKNIFKRKELYENLQQQFLIDSPFVIILQQQEIALVSNKVKGFQLGLSASTTEYKNVAKIF